jgi:hypothetical protein
VRTSSECVLQRDARSVGPTRSVQALQAAIRRGLIGSEDGPATILLLDVSHVRRQAAAVQVCVCVCVCVCVGCRDWGWL